MKLYKKVKILALTLGGVLAINTSFASLLVEPHLGFNIHATGTGNGGAEYDYNGARVGLRAGYQALGFMTGLDYAHTNYDQDTKISGATTTHSQSRNEIGAFVGYNLPILLRFWGAYYIHNSAKDTVDSSKRSGNSKELGVGLTTLPFVSINLVYRLVDFDELETSSGAKTTIDDSNKEITLGVSLPLTL